MRLYNYDLNKYGRSFAAGLLLLILMAQPLLPQTPAAATASPSPTPLPSPSPTPTLASFPGQPAGGTKRLITLSDAVSIFLQQNLQLVAARYDVDTADAEKLTAKLRPNPDLTVGSSGIPLKFTGPFINQQTFAYSISQDLELGKKRAKRIDAAAANSAVAEAQFQTIVWQMTNDVKKKFYNVLLTQSLLDLAKENQKTFADIVTRTTEVFKLGEISGLDLQRLEIEKFKFDTDLANAERDYALAIRDLRIALGGDYTAMEVDVAGSIDYYEMHDFSYADMRDKALAARPDLKAAQLTEKAADAAIVLQDAQKIPNLTVLAGVNQIPAGGSNYTLGVGITLPISDRNQGERAKAQIDKRRAQNQQAIITNQIISDVDKALIAYNIQKRRIELYRTGVLDKVTNIQTLTEYALKAGENSTLDLLDAIRTRRDTLAGFYQTIFDYESSLLDLELATATTLQK